MQNEERGVMPPPLPQPSASGGMYNPVLENLIEAALADGVLTEKEKQVLFKRAQAQGIDLDEFEMVLDAKLFERQQAGKRVEASVSTERPAQSAPKSGKYGDVRKCPSCGAMIGTFLMACPECGHEFVGVGANAFVEKFAKGLQAAISLAQNKQFRSVGGLVGQLQGLMDLQQQVLEQNDNQRSAKTEKAEAEYVRTAVLPRTKEDCIEMLNFVLPKIKVSGANYTTKEWRKYYTTVLEKLEMGGGNDKELASLVSYYRKQLQVSALGRVSLWWSGVSKQKKTLLGVGIVYLVLLAISGVFVAIGILNQ